MRVSTQRRIVLRGNQVDYDVVVSKSARQTRVRVGPGGVEVIQPLGVGDEGASTFLHRNENWVLAQLARVARLRSLRHPERPRLARSYIVGTRPRCGSNSPRPRQEATSSGGATGRSSFAVERRRERRQPEGWRTGCENKRAWRLRATYRG